MPVSSMTRDEARLLGLLVEKSEQRVTTVIAAAADCEPDIAGMWRKVRERMQAKQIELQADVVQAAETGEN